MAVDLTQSFTNPITQETFRCLSDTEEAYVMEWIVQPKGFVPFEHIHVSQDEIFHVKQGQMRVLINGKEQIGNTGATLSVPRGVRHIAYNNATEELICVVEYRPGLDISRFFQCFGGLTADCDFDRRHGVNLPKMMYFMKKMNVKALARPARVPAPMFDLLLNAFHVIGGLAGWERLYRKYTEE